MKGIVSFYQIAKKVNADFKIYFKHPFEINLFLESNLYNWNSNAADLQWNPASTEILYLMDDFNTNPKELIISSNKKKFIVYSNIDYSITINEGFNLDEQNAAWRRSFHELFKKSDYLNSKIVSLFLENKRIAIHTRFTSILGDFKDSSHKVVSNERKEEIRETIKNTVMEISKANQGDVIYVFSDSINFLNYIKRQTSCKVIEGDPKHIDYTKHSKVSIENHLKTFADFFVIAESETVFLLKTEEMHNSAFAKYAAIVGDKEFKTINI
ncbi:hypothetical protein [Flavobacterium maritimum]|uniref:hypothetical protein n=1 Tax=Flavobacterium maritimum TaxID=3149042 RepID=UPI0032B469E0